MNIPLGKLITNEQQRDAIHIAIAPVVANEKLAPGDHIGLLPNGKAGEVSSPVGVVDPFLTKIVRPGESFWMLLYPNTITGMRHEWEHPAFSPKSDPSIPAPISDSEQWIRDYADSYACDHLGYDDLMEAARNYVKHGEYLCHGGRFEGMGVSDEFWLHYERVTGEPVPESKRGSIFTCSC